MSTGDQTQYVRAKLAERSSGKNAHFMKDGFDRWAESSQPAREGQIEKIPAEEQMASYGGALTYYGKEKIRDESYGGAMTVRKAKSRLHKLGEIHDLEGGGPLDDAKRIIEQAVGYARQFREFWQKASKFVDDLETDLKEEILANPKYNTNENLVKTVTGFLTILTGLKTYKSMVDEIAKGMEAMGLGKRRRRRGGIKFDTTALAEFAKKVMGWINFLLKAASNLRPILGLPSLQPYGKQILGFLEPILKLVGASRHRSCECEGGAKLKDKMVGEWHKFTSPLENMIIDKSARYRSQLPTAADKYLAGRTMGPNEAAEQAYRPAENEVLDYLRRREALEAAQRAAEKGLPHSAKYLAGEGCGGRKRAARKVAIMEGPSLGGRKPSARGAIVKKVMAEHGLSLPQASKYVKEHGLY